MKTTTYDKVTLRIFIGVGHIAGYAYILFAITLMFKDLFAGSVHLGCAIVVASLVHLIGSVAKAIFEIRDTLAAKTAQP